MITGILLFVFLIAVGAGGGLIVFYAGTAESPKTYLWFAPQVALAILISFSIKDNFSWQAWSIIPLIGLGLFSQIYLAIAVGGFMVTSLFTKRGKDFRKEKAARKAKL